jgi:hypothetical protein
MALSTRPTYIGNQGNRGQQIDLYIPGGQAASEPGIITLETGATTPAKYKLFFTTAGVLRATTGATFADGDGTAVGAAASVTLDQAYANGATIDGAISSGTAIKLGGAGASDNISLYHDATDMYIVCNTGDLKISAQGGDINFDNEHVTTTGKVVCGSTALTMGATAAGAYIYSNAGVLTLYDATYGAAITLTQLAGGALNNPTVTGDFTITDGKITWTDAVAEIAGSFTFSNTTTDGIDILAQSMTTANLLHLRADALDNGALVHLQSSAAGWGTGSFIKATNDGSTAVWTVGVDGAHVIAGTAAGTAALTLTLGDLVISSGEIAADCVADAIAYDFARNHASSTAEVMHIHQDHTGSTGPCLALVQDATGAAQSFTIATAGTGTAVTITNSVVTGTGLTIVGPASQTASQLILDGTTGSWLGAATTGLLHITTDGALVADASCIRVYSHGNIAAANDGYALEIVEDGSAQATSYAVRIASTSNEALHVDTGLSLFDENITIAAGGLTLTADDITVTQGKIALTSTQDEVSCSIVRNHATSTSAVCEVEQTHTGATGSGLLIDQNATGNAIGLEITHDGDLAAIDITAGAARTGKVINIPMANQLAEIALSINGAATGTSGYGIIDINSTGVLAGNALRIATNTTNAATGQLAYLTSSGKQAAATNGICLYASDTGAATATSYSVYITSTNNEALKVDAGLSVFDEGPIIQYIAAGATDNAPKIAELNAAFGITVGASYNGFIGILYDNTHANDHYICVVSNAVWSWVKTTEASA